MLEVFRAYGPIPYCLSPCNPIGMICLQKCVRIRMFKSRRDCIFVEKDPIIFKFCAPWERHDTVYCSFYFLIHNFFAGSNGLSLLNFGLIPSLA